MTIRDLIAITNGDSFSSPYSDPSPSLPGTWHRRTKLKNFVFQGRSYRIPNSMLFQPSSIEPQVIQKEKKKDTEIL